MFEYFSNPPKNNKLEMQMRVIQSKQTTLSEPFLMRQMERIDNSTYSSAVTEAQALGDSYDPELQTSRHRVYAGSELTYSDTFSGALIKNSDDARQSDT